jgi:phage gp36-like protein
MAYATVAAFVAYVREPEARALAPTAPPSAAYDAPTIDGALARASATMDSYFATRYETPLQPVPAIVEANCMILAHEALDRTGRKTVTDAADRVRAWLKDVSKGVATLGVLAGSAEEPASAGGDDAGVLIDSPARVFDDAGLAAYLRG